MNCIGLDGTYPFQHPQVEHLHLGAQIFHHEASVDKTCVDIPCPAAPEAEFDGVCSISYSKGNFDASVFVV